MAEFTIKTTPIGIEIEATCNRGEVTDVVDAIAKAKQQYAQLGCFTPERTWIGDPPNRVPRGFGFYAP